MAKKTSGNLPDSWLRSAAFRKLLRESSAREKTHNYHSAAAKVGARKRGYVPIDMEHKRSSSEHEESGSVTFYETRGVRDSSVTFLFSDIDETLSLGNHTGIIEADTNSLLFEAANFWLKEAGENNFVEVADKADTGAQSVRTKKQKNRIERRTFQRWWFEVGMKHGFLSPPAIAANFLTASDYIHRLSKGNQQLLHAIYQFADAWHWMHFEGKGEHELAVIGWKSAKGRAQGPAAMQERSELKKRLVKQLFDQFAADDKNAVARKVPKSAAGAILPLVNQKLQELGVKRFAAKTLENELRPLIKERFPKPSKQKKAKA